MSNRTEFHGCAGCTSGQRPRQKRATQVLSCETRYEREQLSGRFERPVPAEKEGAHLKGDQQRQNDGCRNHVGDRLDRVPHAVRARSDDRGGCERSDINSVYITSTFFMRDSNDRSVSTRRRASVIHC